MWFQAIPTSSDFTFRHRDQTYVIVIILVSLTYVTTTAMVFIGFTAPLALDYKRLGSYC